MLQTQDIFEDGLNMTFQVGVVCKDGIVIVSDSRVVYITPATGEASSASQSSAETKFLYSPNDLMVCTYAGGPQSEPTASAVALAVEKASFHSEVEWRNDLQVAADSVKRGSMGRYLLDEVIVCRSDTFDAFWLVSKFTDGPANARRITRIACAGDNASARFLTRLYREDMDIVDGTKLALLILTIAAMDNPSSIGEPFEVVHITQSGISRPKKYEQADIIGMVDFFSVEVKQALAKTLSGFSAFGV